MKTPTIAIHIITPDLDQVIAALDRVPMHLASHAAWTEVRSRLYSLRERLGWLIAHAHLDFELPNASALQQREFDFDEDHATFARQSRGQRRARRCVLDTTEPFRQHRNA